jgi:hypothetical protein
MCKYDYTFELFWDVILINTNLVCSEHFFIHMEGNVRFAAKSDNPSDLHSLMQQTHDEVSQIDLISKRKCNKGLIKFV